MKSTLAPIATPEVCPECGSELLYGSALLIGHVGPMGEPRDERIVKFEHIVLMDKCSSFGCKYQKVR